MTTQFTLLTIPDGAEIAADSRSQLVDQIIPGHGDLPVTEAGIATALGLREDHLASLAQRAQAIVMASLTVHNPEAIQELNEDALTAIYHDRGSEQIAIDVWDSDIPLFVMASSYAPYTEVPRPRGDQVVFLDSLNETTFLDSVVATGLAELYSRECPDES